jgi:hypothetical protein
MEVDHSAFPAMLEEEEKPQSAFNATSKPRQQPMDSYLDGSQISGDIMVEHESDKYKPDLSFNWNY